MLEYPEKKGPEKLERSAQNRLGIGWIFRGHSKSKKCKSLLITMMSAAVVVVTVVLLWRSTSAGTTHRRSFVNINLFGPNKVDHESIYDHSSAQSPAITSRGSVLVAVVTSPQTIGRTVDVHNTWGYRVRTGSGRMADKIDIAYFLGSKVEWFPSVDAALPRDPGPHPFILNRRLESPPFEAFVVLPDVFEKGSHYITSKTLAIWRHLYDNQAYKYHDWFMKADDDTYIVPANLLEKLSKFNPGERYFLGRLLFTASDTMTSMASGGAGYIFSRALLEAFGPYASDCMTGRKEEDGEDVVLSACLEKYLNIKPQDVRWLKPVTPGMTDGWREWDNSYDMGFDEEPASFHYCSGMKMYEFDYLIHDVLLGTKESNRSKKKE